jgi:hypothetical protein
MTTRKMKREISKRRKKTKKCISFGCNTALTSLADGKDGSEILDATLI